MMRKRFAVICLLSLGLFGCPSDDHAPRTAPAAETNKAEAPKPAAEAPKPAAEAQPEVPKPAAEAPGAAAPAPAK